MSRKYSQSDLILTWEPEKCMHSKRCWKELGSVFQPTKRPWINLDGAEKERIIEQVKRCPSGALSIESPNETGIQFTEMVSVSPMKDGPLIVEGKIVISLSDGTQKEMEKCALCRCGASANKPFCDGEHSKIGFIA
jgi:uncharacterized Fe-S cluster protein YjdI